MACKPVISIIVAVYNVQYFINDTLASLLEQDLSGVEIIIVDDGSEDDSGKICDRVAAQYSGHFRVIHQENRGLYEARKTGVQNANGCYVMFLDGDDFLKRDAVECVKCALNETGSDVILFRMCRNTSFAPDNSSSFFAPDGEEGSISIKELRRLLLTTDTVNNVVSKAVKRSCLTSFIAEEESRRIAMAEDKLISSHILEHARTGFFLDKVLYYYRPNAASITKKAFSLQRFQDLTFVHAQLSLKLHDWGMEDIRGAFEALYLSQVCDQMASLAIADASRCSKMDILASMRDNRSVRQALDFVDMSYLHVHRRLSVGILRVGNCALLLAWMIFYEYIMELVEKRRGR